MIKLTATALIHYISPVMQVSDNFQKRELILDDSWEKDGKTYPNYVIIEFTGDKMPMLDNFTPGQRVTVDAYVNGREYQGRYFNSIKGMGIVPYQASSTVGQRPAQPAPGSYPQQPTYPQAPGAYQQGGYPQAPGGYLNSLRIHSKQPIPSREATHNHLPRHRCPRHRKVVISVPMVCRSADGRRDTHQA